MSILGVTNDNTQISIALDRSHAVGSLMPGSIDIVQHRRGGAYMCARNVNNTSEVSIMFLPF